MKKAIAIILCLLCVLFGIAQAETLYTLKDVQQTIMNNTPLSLSMGKDVEAELSGTVVEITDPQAGRILYRIETDGDGTKALILGYKNPCFIAASNDTANIGDKVTVNGKLNIVYSSYTVPFIGQATISVE